MKRSVPSLLKENESEDDEIWDYKCLKREKRDPLKGSRSQTQTRNDNKTVSQLSGRTAKETSSSNKRLEKKIRQKKTTSSKKQGSDCIKKEESENRHTTKLSQKNENTPSKSCRSDVLEGYCPHCQVPYSALSFKSPTWHVNECLDRDMPTIECHAGLACDNILPDHYWKFSHWQLAQLRGSGQKNNMFSISCHQKDKEHNSHVKINLFDDNLPGHSKQSTNKNKACETIAVDSNDDRNCKNNETLPVVTGYHDNSEDNKNSIGSEEEMQKDLNEMLANAFDEDSTESTGVISSSPSVSKVTDQERNSLEDNALVITKETFRVQADEGISYSPLSSPGGTVASSPKSFSQGSLDNFMKRELKRNPSPSLPVQESLPFKTPTKPRPSSARKSSNKKSTNNKEATSDLESPRMTPSSKKVRKSSSKKNTWNNLLEACESVVDKSPSANQLSVKSFFKSLNVKKILFEKSSENTSAAEEVSTCLLSNSNCLQVTAENNVKELDPDENENNRTVCAGAVPQVVIQEDSDDVLQGTSSLFYKNRNTRTEAKSNEDCFDLSRVKEEPLSAESNSFCQKLIAKQNTEKSQKEEAAKSNNFREKHVLKENTDKSQSSSTNTKNAFSVLMEKPKSQSVKQSKTSQSVPAGKVDAMALLMKAKQWGTKRKTSAEGNYGKSAHEQQSTSTATDMGGSEELNIPEPEKRQWKEQRQCPFYKKMPGTRITVDAFSFGTIPECSAYFLSHFHYDHYRGLTKKFKHPIYCSKVTANLVETRLKVERQYLHALPMDIPTVVEGVEVTLLEANHCPGSVLFLFKLKGGRTYLHTGDFRACTEMESYPALTGIHVHQLYLDTTYCDPSHSFPPQQEVIDFAVSTVSKKLKENTKTLIVCGSYTIGKERIFMAIAKALNTKICVTREKKIILDCLEDKSLQESITLSPGEAKVHVLPMNKLNQKALSDYLGTLKNYTEILAFEPTGWTHSNNITSLDQLRPKFSRNGIHIYGVPYSEHSSYLEMKRFTQHLKPDKILPTVNNGNARARTKMEGLFKSWMEELKKKGNQNQNGAKQGTLSSWTS